MYLIPENLGPKVGGQFCNCIIKPEAICFGHLGKKKKVLSCRLIISWWWYLSGKDKRAFWVACECLAQALLRDKLNSHEWWGKQKQRVLLIQSKGLGNPGKAGFWRGLSQKQLQKWKDGHWRRHDKEFWLVLKKFWQTVNECWEELFEELYPSGHSPLRRSARCLESLSVTKPAIAVQHLHSSKAVVWMRFSQRC